MDQQRGRLIDLLESLILGLKPVNHLDAQYVFYCDEFSKKRSAQGKNDAGQTTAIIDHIFRFH